MSLMVNLASETPVVLTRARRISSSLGIYDGWDVRTILSKKLKQRLNTPVSLKHHCGKLTTDYLAESFNWYSFDLLTHSRTDSRLQRAAIASATLGCRLSTSNEAD